MNFRYLRTGTSALKLAARVLIFASVAALAACGGGGSEDPAPQAANPPSNPPSNPPANQAPTISGTPASQVMQNSAYAFTPSANDPEGSTLTFSITNKPSWATFSTSTGALTGTPGGAAVGNYQNIQISVSDGQATASLTSFSINVVATATGAATLTWSPPTQNTDGTAITGPVSYKIYWGPGPGNYPNNKPVPASAGTTAIVDQLTPGTYYFVVTAIDGSSTESVPSNVATKTIS